MGETTIEEDLVLIVHGMNDEELSELVKDPGMLGNTVRKELTNRGHTVHYSNTNGVQEGSVVLAEHVEEATESRADSADLTTTPGQTLEQQAEGTDDIDPTYAAGAQEVGAGAAPSSEEE